ncbi:hypothetical protein [Sulfitobacter guttiformis]|uniref:Lipoprotein n=1 Tax=Sulfitobacter guttiformis TaxID=74349 RepID=A0A420DNC8_9RHOB|nr:hypothetical protein [Sulfitobacter guttiformis]KIN73000.1 hypothetical protein Z949_2182 [Sulfitobacter guttiformis KCTC 32187]RKE95687.1 hypothetical protein C8N30_0224 [Sulfitobacter guttiformis]
MKLIGSTFALISLFALVACDERTGSSVSGQAVASAAPAKQAGQLCALSAAQCKSFSTREAALLPVLNKTPTERSAIDDTTVQLVLDTFVSSQAVADKSCTPVTGSLERKAQLVSKSGQIAVLMGRGSDVCTLIRSN